VFMDCDDFKLVNDQFGHASGDTLLRRIVETARESTRASDTVARLGGDEFAILLPNTPEAGARAAVSRFKKALESDRTPVQWDVTLSIGVASFEDANFDADQILKLSDSIMYRAKRAGRGQIAYEHFASVAETQDRNYGAVPKPL